MARVSKQGLDYFPLDVNFLLNRKVRKLVRKHGPETIAAIIAIFSTIYSEKGYYLPWDEDICFDLSERANMDTDKVQAIIIDAMKLELFSPEMFRAYGILTSQAIQKQYLQCTHKRKTAPLDEKYKLIETEIPAPQTAVSGTQTPLSDTETPLSASGMQQSKVKESKLKENHTTPLSPPKRRGPPEDGRKKRRRKMIRIKTL